MKFRVKTVCEGHYRIQHRGRWSFRWKDEGTVFTNMKHALYYVAELRAVAKAGDL